MPSVSHIFLLDDARTLDKGKASTYCRQDKVDSSRNLSNDIYLFPSKNIPDNLLHLYKHTRFCSLLRKIIATYGEIAVLGFFPN